jgi:hypothetical protein
MEAQMPGLLFLVAVYAASGVQAQGVCFPGSGETVSTTAGHRIFYRWQDDSHVLYVERKAGGPAIRLIGFEREACVHWAPGGDRFALTVYAGSNLSGVAVIRTDDLSRRAIMANVLPDAVRRLLSGSLRGYVEAATWDSRGLILRVHGERSGEPGGFDVNVRCTVDGPVPKCVLIGAHPL